jgi:hypothetical protein
MVVTLFIHILNKQLLYFHPDRLLRVVNFEGVDLAFCCTSIVSDVYRHELGAIDYLLTGKDIVSTLEVVGA